jgi:hypothetical protein
MRQITKSIIFQNKGNQANAMYEAELEKTTTTRGGGFNG